MNKEEAESFARKLAVLFFDELNQDDDEQIFETAWIFSKKDFAVGYSKGDAEPCVRIHEMELRGSMLSALAEQAE